MKKNFIIALLFFLISPNLFADGIPTWYTEDINVSEQEISRKNSEGVYADFIDRTFSACSYVKVDDEIQSLEEARTAAENYKSKFEKDRKNSWRNVIFELEEGTITEYSPQILIEDSEKKVSIGTIFVYQKL